MKLFHSWKRWQLIALVCVVLVLIFLLDNRPKSPDDIMKCANIPTLAVIPANPNLSGDKKHKRKAGKT